MHNNRLIYIDSFRVIVTYIAVGESIRQGGSLSKYILGTK